MRIIFVFLLWIGAILLWVFNVLIPYGVIIINHIESVVNTGAALSLLLIFKYILYIIGYLILIKLCIWVITAFIALVNPPTGIRGIDLRKFR